jgi:hypothetical protein
LPCHALEPARVDRPARERLISCRRSRRRRRHQVDGHEERRSHGEEAGAAAEHLLGPAEGRLDGVERDVPTTRSTWRDELYSARVAAGSCRARGSPFFGRTSSRPRALAAPTNEGTYDRLKPSLFTIEVHSGNVNAKSTLGSAYWSRATGGSSPTTTWSAVRQRPERYQLRAKSGGGEFPARLLSSTW